MADRRRSTWLRWSAAALAAAGLLAAGAFAAVRYPEAQELLPLEAQEWLGRLQPEPAWRSLPVGPVLAAARERGSLRVGVRAYPRPAPPGSPAPSEPDRFDADLARFIGLRLGLPVTLVNLEADARTHAYQPPDTLLDIVIAGADAQAALPAGAQPVATPYVYSAGQLLVLRNESALQRAADLHRRAVCAAQGSPYAGSLRGDLAAEPRIYPSAIHAISAFMAGECQALVEDPAVLARLRQQPEWRFYRALDGSVAASGAPAQVLLRRADPQSAELLDRVVRYWRSSGAWAEARQRRVGDLSFESTQLQDGLVCHS
ncbi:substrate-binding periplasmic protein [Xylophilus sp.]|uniref:substrate-binding periplasmic protein n=1 Tax=Xylophilus sp. TaxID=2653893 RepID=UPI0013BA2E4F|nr:transporter substrate-binding domain-containing protein [Xylophilus sp.]KAF1046938.1 MAG: hypothetical protein GAK38_02154 [Xylophilus sp.]